MEIYLKDLISKTQKEVLSFMKIKNETEGNLDIMPLFVLE